MKYKVAPKRVFKTKIYNGLRKVFRNVLPPEVVDRIGYYADRSIRNARIAGGNARRKFLLKRVFGRIKSHVGRVRSPGYRLRPLKQRRVRRVATRRVYFRRR